MRMSPHSPIPARRPVRTRRVPLPDTHPPLRFHRGDRPAPTLIDAVARIGFAPPSADHCVGRIAGGLQPSLRDRAPCIDLCAHARVDWPMQARRRDGRCIGTRLTRTAHGGTTIRGQYPRAGECSAPFGAKPMIRSVRSVARRPDCSRRLTPVACACWISAPLRMRCVVSGYPDLSERGIIAPASICAVGSGEWIPAR